MKKPTEEDGQVCALPDECVEHFVGDVFDFVALDVVDEPFQNFLLDGQITVEHTGHVVFKVDERGQVIDSVLFGHVVIVDFDETDALLVAFVVNVFQFGQDPLRFRSVVIVCVRIKLSKCLSACGQLRPQAKVSNVTTSHLVRFVLGANRIRRKSECRAFDSSFVCFVGDFRLIQILS